MMPKIWNRSQQTTLKVAAQVRGLQDGKRSLTILTSPPGTSSPIRTLRRRARRGLGRRRPSCSGSCHTRIHCVVSIEQILFFVHPSSARSAAVVVRGRLTCDSVAACAFAWPYCSGAIVL